MGPSPLPAARRRRSASDPAAALTASQAENAAAEPRRRAGWWRTLRRQITGVAGKAWSSSVGVHLLLLGVLFILPMYSYSSSSSLSEPDEITTIVASEPVEEVHFEGPVTTEIVVPPELDAQLEEERSPLFAAVAMEPALMQDIVSADLTGGTGGAGGTGEGEGAGHGTGLGGLGVGGIRIAEPGNAIRAGNFSVWSWPIEGKDLSGKILHGRPGSAPRVFQDYHIVIRIRAPKDRKAIELTDFSGNVIGTDKYYQRIPDDAFYYTPRGELVPARGRQPIPVIEGTAELLIRVPGAASPSVRDTIKVRSKILNEEQAIELVFKSGE